MSGGTQCCALPRRRSEKLKYKYVNKYFTSSSGDRTHNQSILRSHFVPLRYDRPARALLKKYISKLTRLPSPKKTQIEAI